MILHRFFLLLPLIWICSDLLAEPLGVHSISLKKAQARITPLYHLEETDGEVTLDQLLSSVNKLKFKKLKKSNLGYSNSHHWLAFSLYNPSIDPIERVISFVRPTLSEATLYIMDQKERGKYKTVSLGRNTPVVKRYKRSFKNSYPITLPPRSNSTFFLRLYTHNTLQLEISYFTKDAYEQRENKELFTLIGILSSLASLLLFNLMLYGTFREKIYLSYSIMVGVLIFFLGTMNGLNDLFLPFITKDWSFWVTPLGCLFGLSFLGFVFHFLKIRKEEGNWKYIYLATALLFIISFFMSFVGINFLKGYFTGFAILVGVIVAIYSAFSQYNKGRQVAKYFFYSFIPFAVFMSIWVVIDFFQMGGEALGIYFLNGILVLQVLVFSLAAVHRITVYKQEMVKSAEEGRQKEKFKNLVYILCHDLANPLCLIQSTSHFLARKGEMTPEQASESWKRVANASDLLAEMLDHVREMRAIDSGKVTIKLTPVPLIETLNEVLSHNKSKISDKGLTVDMEAPKGLEEIRVLAEPRGLKTVILSNLLTNAIKFSYPKSPIQIRIEQQENQVKLFIKDRGIGIPEKIKNEIFEDNKVTTRTGTGGEVGTGFGMPLVQAYVHSFEGSIEIDSQPEEDHPDDHGTTFIVTLLKAS